MTTPERLVRLAAGPASASDQLCSALQPLCPCHKARQRLHHELRREAQQRYFRVESPWRHPQGKDAACITFPGR